ncbi:MAG TPA: ligase-associated DNA damage response endonuclease PdeM [Polyangiaceae bacterium]|nr:ligase-associated DNA damage response endonuclease PdeM [Polyangiaceae bacterium]
MIDIDWGGEQLTVLPERALYWPRKKTLIIADPHFGKAATFRQAGIPIPRGTTTTDLDRLRAIVRRTGAERLVVLGDFFHSRSGRQEETLAAIGSWRTEHRQLALLLVRGNHDAHAGDPPDEWNITCCDDPFREDAFWLAHHPRRKRDGHVLAGHLHPALSLDDCCGSSLRSVCFWFQPRVAVLPAFGRFTGAKSVRPSAGDRVFVVDSEAVIEIPSRIFGDRLEARG